MNKIRVLTVDDEPLALKGANNLLRKDPELEVLEGCADGASAVFAITEQRPDLVLLDVQLPGMDGFEIIRAVGPDAMPAVVFVTAFDKYAIDAFEASAIDYLLKPYSDERFAAALARGKKAVRDKKLVERSAQLANLIKSGVGLDASDNEMSPKRISVRMAGRIYFVAVADIDWIQGADYYARLHANGRGHLVRESLGSLAKRLDPSTFYRVHRSAIVNVSRIKEIHGMFHGDAIAVLHNGMKVPVARGRAAHLKRLVEGA